MARKCANVSANSLIFWLALWYPDHEERSWTGHQVLQRAHRYSGRSKTHTHTHCIVPDTTIIAFLYRLVHFYLFFLPTVRTHEEGLGSGHRRLIGPLSSNHLPEPGYSWLFAVHTSSFSFVLSCALCRDFQKLHCSKVTTFVKSSWETCYWSTSKESSKKQKKKHHHDTANTPTCAFNGKAF